MDTTEQLSLHMMSLWCEIVMKVIYTLSMRDTCPLKEIVIHSNKMAHNTQRLPHMPMEND